MELKVKERVGEASLHSRVRYGDWMQTLNPHRAARGLEVEEPVRI